MGGVTICSMRENGISISKNTGMTKKPVNIMQNDTRALWK